MELKREQPEPKREYNRIVVQVELHTIDAQS